MDGGIKQNKQAEIDFFNKFGSVDNDFDAFDERGYQRLIREFTVALPPGPGLKVADLGCGTGVFTKRLHDKGYDVVGIDIAPHCIEFARRKYPGVKFEAGDIEHLSYPDETFDAVTLFGVMHHFPDLGDVLKSCRRLLKKGGVLFSFDPNRNNPFSFIYHSPKSLFYAPEKLTENERLLTKEEVKKALSDANFENCGLYCVGGVTLYTGCGKYSRLVKLFGPLYNFSERLFDLLPLGNLVGSSLISVSKK